MPSVQMTRYYERKSRGICVHCGKRNAVSGEIHCSLCKEYFAEWRSKRTQKQLAQCTKIYRKWQANNLDKIAKRDLCYIEKLRTDILAHYGAKCSCCGETDPAFLTVDHINGKGNAHRRFLFGANISGRRFWAWLRRNNYPLEYQILCWNCNMAKAHYGICPHQNQKVDSPTISRL